MSPPIIPSFCNSNPEQRSILVHTEITAVVRKTLSVTLTLILAAFATLDLGI